MHALLEILNLSNHVFLLRLPTNSNLVHDDALFLVDFLGASSIGLEMVPLCFPSFTNHSVLLNKSLDHMRR